MIHKSFDLLLVIMLALIALLVVLAEVVFTPLRVLLGLPLALLLPGYALTAALFAQRTISATDRIVYSLGLSLSISVLCGFALNYLPWGLQPASWALLLNAVIIGCCIWAWVERQRLHITRTSTALTPPSEKARPTRAHLPLRIEQAVLFGCAIAVLALAIGLARTEALQHPPTNVVQLWMLPGASSAEPNTLRVGVISVGEATGTFRLQLQHNGATLREWPTLTLTPGQHWQESIILPGEQLASGAFEARLYRLEAPSVVYRRVSFWPD